MVSGNFQTESEGALGMMYAGVSDVAPMGDDAKITDQMPFYNTYGYTPTEISVATGCYNHARVPLRLGHHGEQGQPDRPSVDAAAR